MNLILLDSTDLRPDGTARLAGSQAEHIRKVLKSAPGHEVRVGLITSRRVGGAVVRNRVRRRLREIVRAAAPHIHPGTWVTLIARQAAAAASLQTLTSEWQQLARRSSILIACS